MNPAPLTIAPMVAVVFDCEPAAEPLPSHRKGKGSGKRRWWLSSGWGIARKLRYLDIPGDHHIRDAGSRSVWSVDLPAGSVVTLGCGERTRIELTIPDYPCTVHVQPMADGDAEVTVLPRSEYLRAHNITDTETPF